MMQLFIVSGIVHSNGDNLHILVIH